VGVRQRLTKWMNLEPRRMALFDLFLERGAETWNLIRSWLRAVPVRPRVPELRAEPTQVVAAAAGSMVEARHIDMFSAYPPIVPRWGASERGQISPRVQPDLLAEITADHVRTIAETVRVRRRFRVQQNARRVD